ncbi:hypothetical protein GcM1_205016 [Golovinomyces cichoracearum]|uniref:Bacteriophage T5 Orf172 DNA-binding domain-containing protein n=1 Tax=Golovinomyces cichoracearum TaxID=62708 RepID=A0A420IX19_9PEZI|nr:hypothetical protein GcM1_205016 [Golovinomyces cichoracearum]
MPYIPNTPESLLPRSDSKNPATTCQGLTNDGKRCRRSLAQNSKAIQSSNSSGLPHRGYCWQHRDQAGECAPTITKNPSKPNVPKVSASASVDTLVNRLGLLDIEPRKNEQKKQPPRLRKKQRSLLTLLCCLDIADVRDENPRYTKENQRKSSSTRVANGTSPKKAEAYQLNQNLQRPKIQTQSHSSRTGEILSLIPPTTSPEIASQLLAVLAKPSSVKDSAGYIYMFWLTPESLQSQPSAETVSLILTSSSPSKVPEQKKVSGVLDTFSTYHPNTRASLNGSSNSKKILLKIGRAENVYRRLNQWTKQCGYNLSLIRYYPYQSSASKMGFKGNASSLPVKVPNVNKVERLIHIEISSKRASHGQCEACGKVHKEWFEVEASREGIKEIDKIIRRWVDWNIRDGSA